MDPQGENKYIYKMYTHTRIYVGRAWMRKL